MLQIEVVGLLVFIVSVVFGAGILFGRVNNHSTTIRELANSICELQKDVTFIREKIVKIEVVLKSHIEGENE